MGSRRLAARSLRAALALAWLALCLIPSIETKVSRSGQPQPAARCTTPPPPPLRCRPCRSVPAHRLCPSVACRRCGRTRAQSWLKH